MRDYGPPYVPRDAKQVAWFFGAPIATCIFTAPLLGAGIFGAPFVLLGLPIVWWQMRKGYDHPGYFALSALLWSGFCAALAQVVGADDIASIAMVGLFFAPIMGLVLGALIGSWKPDAE